MLTPRFKFSTVMIMFFSVLAPFRLVGPKTQQNIIILLFTASNLTQIQHIQIYRKGGNKLFVLMCNVIEWATTKHLTKYRLILRLFNNASLTSVMQHRTVRRV